MWTRRQRRARSVHRATRGPGIEPRNRVSNSGAEAVPGAEGYTYFTEKRGAAGPGAVDDKTPSMRGSTLRENQETLRSPVAMGCGPKELRERFAAYGLELHPEKTRLIEFGRYASENRDRDGRGKPETFDFLGFTHICGKTRKGGFVGCW